MIKNLLGFIGGSLLLLPFMQAHSQVKGDPQLNTSPVPQTSMERSSSKLSAPLTQLYERYTAPSGLNPNARARPEIPETPLNKFMRIEGSNVLVDITLKTDFRLARPELEKMGFKVISSYGRIVSGMMPISSLPKFEAAGSIQFVRPAYRSRPKSQLQAASAGLLNNKGLKASNLTPVISQGDTAMRSYLARKNSKVTGKGVKIGILSDSYDNLGTADLGVKNGELPGPDNPFNYKKPVQVLMDLDSNGADEGRGMAEIVHDVAPGAEIYFHTADYGQANFANGILDLANHGCRVITDDIFYYAEPFFQDGIIAQAINKVKDAGVAYFSAAGNEGVASYESDYRPSSESPLGPGFGTAHNFSAPGATPRYYQPIYIPTNGFFIADFQWDEPFYSAGGAGTASDLDILLVDINGKIVAGSADDNSISGDPFELFGYFNTTLNNTFFLVITKWSGTDPRRLKYVHFGDGLFYLTTPAIPGILAPSLVGHPNAEGAIATGATAFFQTPAYGTNLPVIEPYSSVGGVPTYFDYRGKRVNAIIRKKPELTTPDNVNTSFFPPFPGYDVPQDSDTFPNFPGTSAAAPHAAAVAALMIEAQKLNTITPAQIKGIMTSNTVDMDDPRTTGFSTGFDYTTGYGLLKADAAVAAVKFPILFVKNLSLKAVCSDDPAHVRKWVITNPNPFEMNVHWFILGFSQQGNLVAQPGQTTFTTQTAYFFNIPVDNIAIIDWGDNFGFSHVDIVASTRAKCGNNLVSADNTDGISEQAITVESVDKANAVVVYPNPSTRNFRVYLSFAKKENIDLALYTIDGKLLYKNVVASSGVVDIDATNYKPGVYILKVKQQEYNKTFKLVKQ
ncbi:MAG: T9SS type A sorting domain-containing protein [Chitinophagaceae bacterium]